MTKPTFKFHFPVSYAAIASQIAKMESLSKEERRRLFRDPKQSLRRIESAIELVNVAMRDGYITPTDSKTVREYLNRFIEDTMDFLIWDRFVVAGKWQDLPRDLQELDRCSEARLIPSFQKKLAKLLPESKKTEMYCVAKMLADELSELTDVVAYLKTIEKKASDVREVVKAKKEEELRIKNDTDVVYQAVLPLRTMAQDKAEELFRARVAKIVPMVAKHNGNLDLIYPVPESLRDEEYNAVMRKRAFLWKICDRVGTSLDGDFLTVNPGLIEHEANAARHEAALEFDMFVFKLNAKINDVTLTAVLEGNPWIGSKLTVTTQNKGVQVWNTKVIVNYSKYGKLFNQFPTRLAK